MQLAINPVSRVVAVYQRQELKLIYDVLGSVSIIGVLSLGDRQDWSLVEFLGRSQAVVCGVYFLLITRIMKERELANFTS